MMNLSLHIKNSYWRRKALNAFMHLILIICGLLVLFPFFNVLSYVITHGASALNLSFFTQLPKPVGEEGGGIAHALAGTAILVALASAIGIPWGVFTGVYLSEYGHGRGAHFIRFSVDLLASVPSIIIGLFVYALVVMPMKHFSAHAGGIALSILMVPTVARSTEEILKLVPVYTREAGLALGLPRWKVILWIVLKGSMGAITTGIMLAIARVAGETAPLLFTAFGNQFWPTGLNQPIASLPVQIYTYAISPYEDWHQKAWAGGLVLVLFVFGTNLLFRLVIRKAGGGEDT